jgi:hypothetical protein
MREFNVPFPSMRSQKAYFTPWLVSACRAAVVREPVENYANAAKYAFFALESIEGLDLIK